MIHPERTLGIDPGSRLCGYGIIEPDGRYVTSGTIVLNANDPLHERLRELYEELTDIVREYRPTIAAVEKVFFAKSVKSALTLGQARGAALVCLAAGGLDVYEYSALEVKKSVVGYGRAEKNQVQHMVKRILGINTDLSPDGADALAVALCHQSMIRLKQAVNAS